MTDQLNNEMADLEDHTDDTELADYSNVTDHDDHADHSDHTDDRLDNAAGDFSEDELSGIIENLCRSKAEEFQLLGYEHVEGKEIWDCVSDKYKDSIPNLHVVVNDILSLKVTAFMNWMTLSAYKGALL